MFPHAFMAWPLIKHNDKFAVSLHYHNIEKLPEALLIPVRSSPF
jgi:hypothetical protein